MNVLELLEDLGDAKLDYVVARSSTTTDKAAYESAGISRSAFYSWGAEERDRMNGIAQKLKRENATKAILKLQDAAEKAAEQIIKLSGKARSENVRMSASVEILDRTMGKAVQKTENETKAEHKLSVEYVNDWREVNED